MTRIENQSLGISGEKGARIYIYIVEDGYFSRGSAVIGKWRSAQFRNHRDLEGGKVSTDRSLNPGYYREKLAATADKFVPLSLSLSLDRSSSRVTRFPLLELTGCSRVTRRRRRRRPIFLPGGVNILRGSSSLSLSLLRGTCHRWNASPRA